MAKKSNSSYEQRMVQLMEPPKPKKDDTKPAPAPLTMEAAFRKVALEPAKTKADSKPIGGTASSSSPLGIQFMTEAKKTLAERVQGNPNGPWSMKTLADTGNLKPYQDPGASNTANTASAADAAPAPLPEQPKPPELSPMAGNTATLEGNAAGFRTKKSRAKQDRMLNQGTSRFKINANSTNTGLNIGRGSGMTNFLRGNL